MQELTINSEVVHLQVRRCSHPPAFRMKHERFLPIVAIEVADSNGAAEPCSFGFGFSE